MSGARALIGIRRHGLHLFGSPHRALRERDKARPRFAIAHSIKQSPRRCSTQEPASRQASRLLRLPSCPLWSPVQGNDQPKLRGRAQIANGKKKAGAGENSGRTPGRLLCRRPIAGNLRFRESVEITTLRTSARAELSSRSMKRRNNAAGRRIVVRPGWLWGSNGEYGPSTTHIAEMFVPFTGDRVHEEASWRGP